MPAFSFEALDAAGRTERGLIDADSARGARSRLRDRGLLPVAVTPAGARRRSPWRRLPAAERLLIWQQLAALIGAGLPIDEALAALAEGATPEIGARLAGLRAAVVEGQPLAEAMAGQPELFDPLQRSAVAAGEAAGKLPRVLAGLATHAERTDALRRRVILALVYPALLGIVSVAVLAGLLVHVVPRIVEVFVDRGEALPWPTRLLIWSGDVASAHGIWLLLAAFGALLLGGLWWRSAQGRLVSDRWLVRAPVVGRLIRANATARYARTLALLVDSSVPLLEALGLAAGVVANRSLAGPLAAVAERVRRGEALARAVAATGALPAVATRLVASGEASGRLPVMLDEAANHAERELDTSLGVFVAALGPAVIIVVGGFVLFIVLAILLPIFELNELVG